MVETLPAASRGVRLCYKPTSAVTNLAPCIASHSVLHHPLNRHSNLLHSLDMLCLLHDSKQEVHTYDLAFQVPA